MDTQAQRVRDTPQRIQEVDQMTTELVEKGIASGIVMHHKLRTYLGIVMFMIQINSQLRSLDQSTERGPLAPASDEKFDFRAKTAGR